MDSIYLQGSEAVESASHRIQGAATDFGNHVSNFSEAVNNLRIQMNEFQQTAERLITELYKFRVSR